MSDSEPIFGHRGALSRQRVLSEAVALADETDIAGLTMRKLGQRLGVEAMSLYHHVANKDDLLDGVADLVAAEFEVPQVGPGWRPALRGSAVSAYRVLLRHPWASGLMESRSMAGPARLRYLEAVLGVLRTGGFSVRAAYHAVQVLDSYVYGFTLQALSWPTGDETMASLAEDFAAAVSADDYPHLVEMASAIAAGQDDQHDFEVGLDAVLDSLDALRQRRFVSARS